MVNTGHAHREFRYILLHALRRISGAIVAVLALRGTMLAYGIEQRDPYLALSVIVALICLLMLPDKSPNERVLPPRISSTTLSVIGRWFLVVGILLLLGYATKTSQVFSRKVLFSWFMLTPPLLIVVQVCIDIVLSSMALSAGNTRRVVIAGQNELGHNLATKIMSSPVLGMKVDGFFDDRGVERLAQGSSAPLLGKLNELPDFVRQHGTDLIFIVLPMRNIQRVTDLLDQLHDTTASIYFVPDVFVFDLIQCRTSDIGGLPIVALCETPFQGTQGMIKAVSDYAIASTVLLFTSPLLITIALAIKLTSPGPVIFKQRRYGLDGHEIIVYKFRTMTVTEDSDDIKQATRDDERVTKVGAILRKHSLDELPQFINVLQGRMSVVGPRPHAVVHNEEYRPLIKGYMVRHKVNPGITGLAQVLGYRGETETVEAMEKRVEYDLEYLRNWSLSLDMRIIARTVRVIVKDHMAY